MKYTNKRISFVSLGPNELMVCQVQSNPREGMLYFKFNDLDEIAPGTARQLAQWLLKAADWVEEE